MASSSLEINGETKVFDLIEAYPELEEILISLAPPFKKLRNPILRRSVAKVASLKQAAKVGGLPLVPMLNTLRSKVGLPPIEGTKEDADTYLGERPDWFHEENVVVQLSEEHDIDESSDSFTRPWSQAFACLFHAPTKPLRNSPRRRLRRNQKRKQFNPPKTWKSN